MPSEMGSVYCQRCQRQTAATRKTPNHILHLLISLFMCGVWLPVWLLIATTSGHYRCNTCGFQAKSASSYVLFAVLLVILIGFGALYGLFAVVANQ